MHKVGVKRETPLIAIRKVLRCGTHGDTISLRVAWCISTVVLTMIDIPGNVSSSETEDRNVNPHSSCLSPIHVHICEKHAKFNCDGSILLF